MQIWKFETTVSPLYSVLHYNQLAHPRVGQSHHAMAIPIVPLSMPCLFLRWYTAGDLPATWLFSRLTSIYWCVHSRSKSWPICSCAYASIWVGGHCTLKQTSYTNAGCLGGHTTISRKDTIHWGTTGTPTVSHLRCVSGMVVVQALTAVQSLQGFHSETQLVNKSVTILFQNLAVTVGKVGHVSISTCISWPGCAVLWHLVLLCTELSQLLQTSMSLAKQNEQEENFWKCVIYEHHQLNSTTVPGYIRYNHLSGSEFFLPLWVLLRQSSTHKNHQPDLLWSPDPSLVPRPFPALSMLHTEKWEG